MMDEHLIAEVQKRGIIYNRQRVVLGDKYVNKELAWNEVAAALSTDVDSCKKRWKYIRERYVQQKKMGDSPNYEHLSRPYFEKMKFLDAYITPRKSYRSINMPNLINSQNSKLMMNMLDGMDSSKSDSSFPMKLVRDHFGSTDMASAMVDAILENSNNQSFTNMTQHNNVQVKKEQQDAFNTHNLLIPNLSYDIPDSDTPPATMPSSSSSVHSMQQSPQSHEQQQLDGIKQAMKRRRSSMHGKGDNGRGSNSEDDEDDINSEAPSFQNDSFYPNQYIQQQMQHQQNLQQYQLQQQQDTKQPRNSEQLLGELVTSELTKMPAERKKLVQKRILEILFFDD